MCFVFLEVRDKNEKKTTYLALFLIEMDYGSLTELASDRQSVKFQTTSTQLKSRSYHRWVSYNLSLLLYKELEKALTFCLWTTSHIYLICCLYQLYKQSPIAGGFIPCFAQHFSTSLINFWYMGSFWMHQVYANSKFLNHTIKIKFMFYL